MPGWFRMFNRRISCGSSILDARGLLRCMRPFVVHAVSSYLTHFYPILPGSTQADQLRSDDCWFCMHGWMSCTASVGLKHFGQRGRFQ